MHARLQVFVNAQARTIDLASCYVMAPTSILVTVSADVTQALLDRLNKYIFFGDEVHALLSLTVEVPDLL